MITIQEALPIRNIALDLEAGDKVSAVIKAAHLLKNDERMLDWAAFYTSLIKREEESTTTIGAGLAIPHARGEFVREMVMGLARLKKPVHGDGGETRYLIVVAVPAWMAADYLRLVGALARIFRDEAMQRQLDAMTTPAEMIELLSQKCR